VATNDLIDAPLEHIDFDRRSHTQRRVQVEQPITRQELIHEPQPLLGKREWKNENFLSPRVL